MIRQCLSLDPEKDTFIKQEDFICSEVFPLAIFANSEYANLVFQGKSSIQVEDCEEKTIFFSILYKLDKNDEEYIKNLPLYIGNISKSEKSLKMYMDLSRGFSPDETYNMAAIYRIENKLPYSYASRPSATEKDKFDLIKIYLNKESFVKINLFMNDLALKMPNAELSFLNPTLNNINYCTPDSITLDGSVDIPGMGNNISNLIFNHYTIKIGPKKYRFKFISPKSPDSTKKLRNPMRIDFFLDMYKDDPIVDKFFYEPTLDCLFIVLEVISDVTKKYKETIVFKLRKELYDHTNFVDYFKIYE